MAVNPTGLLATVDAAERAAAAAVNGLGGKASAADLTRASFEMSKFQMIATAVSAVIKADSEAKTAAARGISS